MNAIASFLDILPDTEKEVRTALGESQQAQPIVLWRSQMAF